MSLINPAVSSLLSQLKLTSEPRVSAAGQFGHDEHLNRLAERDGALDGAFSLRKPLRALIPCRLRGGQLAGAGAVGQQ